MTQPLTPPAGENVDAYLIADDRSVALADCPIGLFMCNGELCLKTEYGNNEGRIDAYIVSSGEFFWGAQPQTIANQRAQRVVPVSVVGVDTPAALSADAILPGREEERHELCLLIEEGITQIDEHTGLPLGREVEKLADAILARQRGGGEETERSSQEPRVSEQSAAVTPSQHDCTADTASSEVERVAGTPLQGDAVERALRQTLEKCRAQFEFYVTAHMNKQPPDMEKAATNQEFVELIDAALTPAQDEEERG